jgi:hypothetical protein
VVENWFRQQRDRDDQQPDELEHRDPRGHDGDRAPRV